ncbi:MAG: hypothetical protein ACE360_10305 [Hyphomicrobiales bacterium]
MPKSSKSTVIKVTNSDRAKQLVAKIDALSKKRQNWEVGAFKASNDELYDILAVCDNILRTLSGNVGLKKAVDTALKDAGHSFRSNTSWELKVIKAVFGEENKRHYAYVRALKIARDKKSGVPSGTTFQDWVRDNGGIEELRVQPKDGPSVAEKAQIARDKADEYFSKAPVLGDRFDPDNSLQPSDDEDLIYSVALVRVDSDGKAGVVFGTNKAAIVRAVLKVAGDTLIDAQDKQDPIDHEREMEDLRETILAQSDEDFDEGDSNADALAA